MISAQIRSHVRERAQSACEYCHLHQDDSPLAVLHIEHIIPKFHGGSDDIDNLALACIDCNLHKGTNLTGIDPETSEITHCFIPGAVSSYKGRSFCREVGQSESRRPSQSRQAVRVE